MRLRHRSGAVGSRGLFGGRGAAVSCIDGRGSWEFFLKNGFTVERWYPPSVEVGVGVTAGTGSLWCRHRGRCGRRRSFVPHAQSRKVAVLPSPEKETEEKRRGRKGPWTDEAKHACMHACRWIYGLMAGWPCTKTGGEATRQCSGCGRATS